MSASALALFALPFLLVSGARDEPVLIQPGSELVTPPTLAAHEATYVLYHGTGAGRAALQRIRREVALSELDTTKLLRISWHTSAMGRDVVDELFLDPKTLAPRKRVIPLPQGGVARLNIEGTRVSGKLEGPDGQPLEGVDVTFETALHDASLPLLLGLPLRQGAEFRLPTLPLDLGETPATPNWITVLVRERAAFELEPGIELDAWQIDLVPEAEGPTTRRRLADEAPYILRKEISMPGMGELTWELTSAQ